MSDPFILTARLAGEPADHLTALRAAHFPDLGYTLPAHLTLFHHLPGNDADAVTQTLRAMAHDWAPPNLRAVEILDFGGGCAFRIDAPALADYRAAIAQKYDGHLTKQDQQGWRPHVTVQNKVDRDTAKALIADLRDGFEPFDIPCPGLILWRYRSGPWDHVADIPFGGME